MFDLYMYPRWPVPCERELKGVYTSKEDLIRDLNLTKSELERLLNGEVIRDLYELELSAKVVRELEIDKIAAAYPEGLKEFEIAEVLNMTENAVTKTLTRFKQRLLKANQLKTFLLTIREYRQTRDGITGYHCSGSITID